MVSNTYLLALGLMSISSVLGGNPGAVPNRPLARTNSLGKAGMTARQSYPTNITTPYTYSGCYTDNNANARALGGPSYSDPKSMIIETCASFCTKYQYFGVEYGRECYCGNTINPADSAVANTTCNIACAGNSTEVCGGSSLISIYTNNNYTAVVPATLNGATYLDCYAEGNTTRVLPDNTTAREDMTPAICQANCAGYQYFGLEYGRECYCGNNPPPTPANASECATPCSGADQYICGGSNRLTVYNVTAATSTQPPAVGNFTYQGCYTDDVNNRTLTGKWNAPGNASLTVETCAAFCAQYAYFGLEDGSQCFCGTALAGSGVKQAEANCSVACPGNANETCGAANALNVYGNNATAATTPGNVAGPVTVGIGMNATLFAYRGCYNSMETNFTAGYVYGDTMDVQVCAQNCVGYTFFGVQDGNVCNCGNGPLGASAQDERSCSYVCVGNATEICGGFGYMSVYGKAG